MSMDDYVDIEAYDKIEVTVTKNSAPVTVEVQPGGAGDVEFIIITADVYANLSFEVDESGTDVTLDGPLMLTSPGLVALLGATCNEIVFTNTHVTIDRNVTILVGRTASG
jgi:hypothetical protein